MSELSIAAARKAFCSWNAARRYRQFRNRLLTVVACSQVTTLLAMVRRNRQMCSGGHAVHSRRSEHACAIGIKVDAAPISSTLVVLCSLARGRCFEAAHPNRVQLTDLYSSIAPSSTNWTKSRFLEVTLRLVLPSENRKADPW